MSDIAFETALIGAYFRLAANDGWRRTTVAGAAVAAGLPLDRTRAEFPGRAAVLLRFGRMADQAALAAATMEGTVRDQLFDLLMRRFDTLQAHRAGVIALLHTLPREPQIALLLSCATKRSMRWMLEAAGVTTTGIRGRLQVRGLVAVWLWGLRAWERDESADLSGTMAALDTALTRAEQAVGWLGGRRREAAEKPAAAEPEAPPEPAGDPTGD
jgi:hypothetical protein